MTTIAMIVLARLLCPIPKKQCGPSSETATGKRASLGVALRHGQARALNESGARYLRVSIRSEDPQNQPWHLIIRDADSHLIETLSSEDLANTEERWTSRLPGDTAWFELDASPGATVRVQKMISMPAKLKATYYSVRGLEPDWKSLYSLSGLDRPIRKWGDYVGFFMTSYDHAVWTCSGVLLSPTLFLTNFHCGAPPESPEDLYWQEIIQKEAIIDLSWDDDGLSREYTVSDVVAKCLTLDYALLRVRSIHGLGRDFGVTIRTGEKHRDIVMIHHPLALPKQVTLGCSVVEPMRDSWDHKESGTEFTHTCDSEGSSSGAPIFNLAGELIGLHHQGFDFDCDCAVVGAKVNKAIHIESILDDLRKRVPAAVAEMTIVAAPPAP